MRRLIACVVFSGCCFAFGEPADTTRPVTGRITHKEMPITGAIVRVPGSPIHAISDNEGMFRLPIRTNAKTITAAKPGFRIAAIGADAKPLDLRLEALPKDNEDYAWIDPSPHVNDAQRCGNCHGDLHAEWARSAHGNSAKNPRFLSLFSGDNGKHKTWNAQAEHPLGAGVCAGCHVPTLSSPDLSYDIRQAKGVDAHGVHCDFCHKIADAPTEKIGTRFGRDGYELIRPKAGDLLSFGPLDDAVRTGESFGFAPVYRESRYCASCHEGVVFGVHAYGTYSEWLASPAKREGKQCQTCHMPAPKERTNIAPGKGGIERDRTTLSRHDFPGATPEMLRNCVKLEVEVKRTKDAAELNVELRAENVGHRVPTGFVDRHLVLVIEAKKPDGSLASVVVGELLPSRAGSKLAGKAGAIFGKQHLSDRKQPLPFWVLEGDYHDIRLVPGEPWKQSFRFDPAATEFQVRVLYRRFWPLIAQERGFAENEFVIHERSLR
ncbi:MAG: multiheme c-type cytochrome [Gemmataceae bacterium]